MEPTHRELQKSRVKIVQAYVVAEKIRLGSTTSQTPKARCWSILAMQITLIIFTFKYVKTEVS
jgi:hypothetical protein